MKRCENLGAFFNSIDSIGGELGKSSAMLFNQISRELGSTHQHITHQLSTLETQLKIFKNSVYSLQVHKMVERLIGGWDQSRMQDSEADVGPTHKD